ncbi:MAG: glycosyltransferase, partial [Aquabacterium sp.]
MLVLKALAVAGVILFVYSYMLYPVLLSLMAGWVQLKRDIRHITGKANRRAMAPSDWPHIGVVIAAFNEEKHIRQRVENLLAQDYPTDKLRIYIGSDGSKDQTGA